MKIAYITLEYPPIILGGMGVYSANLTRELANLGHEVHVIAPHFANSEKEELSDGVFVHRMSWVDKDYLRALSFWIDLRKKFYKIRKQVGGFDIVNGNQFSDFSLASTRSSRGYDPQS